VYVQAAELRAIDLPKFTIPDWAHIDQDRQRVVDGDQQIAPGIAVAATPGHTPGHQSVVIEHDDHRSIIVGQCCYTCDEFELGQPSAADMHDDSMLATGIESLRRLRRLEPTAAYFSHDLTVYRPRSQSSSDPSRSS
jgi:glyoxylase-like metal-dependent hydrolase (beta-lactamase superfamily II)